LISANAPSSAGDSSSSSSALAGTGTGPGGGPGGGGGGGGGTGAGTGTCGGNGSNPIVQKLDADGTVEKAVGPNTDRTDPITPATGSTQTTDTANSKMGIIHARELAENTVKSGGPEALYGSARERANMGKGAVNGYSFSGPYDYPTYPGGKPDDSLTMMGGWTTRRGRHESSLWTSRMNSKGQEGKRNKYYKWSTKGGGNWRKMNKDEMINVFQKQGREDGGNFFGVNPGGTKFKDMIARQLKQKEADNAMAKVGGLKMENDKMGFVGGQKKRKRESRQN
jgi:hypothetical protein